MHRVIKFNRETRLKLYIDINTDLKKNAINDFEKDFLNLINNVVSEKTMGNIKKAYRYQTCNNRSKKELFSVKILYFFQKIYQP